MRFPSLYVDFSICKDSFFKFIFFCHCYIPLSLFLEAKFFQCVCVIHILCRKLGGRHHRTSALMVSRVGLWALPACLWCQSTAPASGARLFWEPAPCRPLCSMNSRAPATLVTVVAWPCCRLALYLASGAWADPGDACAGVRRRRHHAPEGKQSRGACAFWVPRPEGAGLLGKGATQAWQGGQRPQGEEQA